MNARLDHDDFGGWVQQLGDPIRARRAYCHLVLSGAAALPAIRAGLRHASADVRLYCTKALDRLVDPDSFAELVEMLCDSDARVRLDALHALACDRCKAMDRRPPTDDSLPAAIRLLRSDSDRHVRAMAAEVVGRFVHTDSLAADALVESREGDPDPAVRKKAGWYAPGGTIYRRTRPAAPRATARARVSRPAPR
jgi:hypothetical protein